MSPWQVLPRDPEQRIAPLVDGGLVKLAELDAALPEGMRRVTPDERAAQIAERVAQHNRRWLSS